jgi:anti-sigma factor RsiW
VTTSPAPRDRYTIAWVAAHNADVARAPFDASWTLRANHTSAINETIQGYNVRHWSKEGLDFWAVSDLAGDELHEFVRKISAAVHPTGPS